MNKLNLDLSGVINSAINEKLASFDLEGQVKELLGDVAKEAINVLTIKLDGGKEDDKRFPLVHKQFEQLLKVGAIAKMNPLLTGGAGLSKTTAVMQFAEALELEFVSISFSNQTTKTDLYGFVDANGIYRSSGFVDAFENGKVFLADEIDACSANVLVLLNSALDNGFLTTADDRTIYMHENFRIVATANTNLRGAKDGFTARNKLDSATTDRFTMIEWQLDEELEKKITNNSSWLKIVRKARANANDMLEGVVITPRSSYKGSKLLKAGLPIQQVIDMVLIKALSKDEAETIMKGISSKMLDEAVEEANGTHDVETVEELEEPEIEEEEVSEEPEEHETEEFEW